MQRKKCIFSPLYEGRISRREIYCCPKYGFCNDIYNIILARRIGQRDAFGARRNVAGGTFRSPSLRLFADAGNAFL